MADNFKYMKMSVSVLYFTSSLSGGNAYIAM